MDDSYSFLKAIRLIVFLSTGKLVNFNFIAFCFFSIWFWIRQHDPFHTKIDLTMVFHLLSTNLKCIMDAFFTKEFTVSLKKTGEMTQR